ncbi:MAG: hypothetical protein IIY99_01785, partial [Firmicutes bacterium]|nr:hypothetical protein [Bacillota bacterium]
MKKTTSKIICAVSLSLAAFFLVVSLVLIIPGRAFATTVGDAQQNGVTVPDAGNDNAGYGDTNQDQSNIPPYGRNDNNTNPYYTDYGSTQYAPNASNSTTSTGGFSLTFDGQNASLSATVRMFLVLTVLAIAPALLVMLTSFTRIIVVLHFIRAALQTQTSPPNQVLAGLALFLTLFIMWPTLVSINDNALAP